MPQLIVFGYRRQVDFNISPSFKKTWVEPLKDYLDVKIVEHNSVDWKYVSRKQPLIFWDRRPPDEVLKIPNVRIVWVPMWDSYTRVPQHWWHRWRQYPIKLISYSRRLTNLAIKANIPVFDIQYYSEPLNILPVSWTSQLNAFYWNRAGLLGKKQIISMCKALDLDNLYYMPIIDYYVPKSTQFSLPEKIGKTRIHTLVHLPHNDYLKFVENTNLYIAPRWFEGIGLTVTEALSAGCVVLSNNAPTMNEYIVDGETGIFLPYNKNLRYLIRLKSKIESRIGLDNPSYSPLIRYDWKKILQHNLPQIGANARCSSIKGRQKYLKSIEHLIDFIFSDW